MNRIMCAFIAICTLLILHYQTANCYGIELKLPFHQIICIGDQTIIVDAIHNNIDNTIHYRTYPFTIIAQAGSYQLVSDVSSNITIAASDVQLDLNGQSAAGIVINNSLSNVSVRNGTVNATGSNGITVGSGCSSIVITDINVRSASTCGILFTQVFDSVIKNCEMTQNGTGINLSSCRNIVIENSNALHCTRAGFSLLTSTTCALIGCKAISTGDGNTQVINTSVTGFNSIGGYGNIFQRCIANSTQALSTTDSNSIIAGFMLSGNERASRIMNCEASNAMTNFTGVTVPYGILLQATLTSLTSVTVVDPEGVGTNDAVFALNWSPDGQYLAVGGSLYGPSTNRDLIIYKFNRLAGSLTAIVSINPSGGGDDNITAINWSPDGQYLAVGGDIYGTSNNDDVIIYSFNRVAETLEPVASFNPEGTGADQISTVKWSSDGQYLAVGGLVVGASANNALIIYKFDKIGGTLTKVVSVNPEEGGDDTVFNAKWSPTDERFLAITGNIYGTPGNNLIIYQFDRATGVLTPIISQSPSAGEFRGLDWSPDGQYLAVGGNITGDDLIIYRFNTTTRTLTQITSTGGGGIELVRTINWSQDGQYLAIGGLLTTNALIIYRFDRGAGRLTQVASVNPEGGSVGDIVYALNWSPDGSYLAVGGDISGIDLIIYSALQFPSNNVIKGNTVYCNSGNQFPNGIGISGSSISNMIIQNTIYSNPLNSVATLNYAFVCNVFNPLFDDLPGLLQNIVLGTCDPIPSRYTRPAGLKELLSRLTDISTKIDLVS